MRAEGSATVYHPRLPAHWWTKNQHYLLYMIRELTAVFAALWVLGFVLDIRRMATGTGHSSPAWLAFSVISLLFVLFHAYTAFSATGTLVYLRMGAKPVPAASINGLMFVAWTIVTIVVGLILVTLGMGG